MTPEQTAGTAMTVLSGRLAERRCAIRPDGWWEDPSVLTVPCGNCTPCNEKAEMLAQYHRLAALYPDAVPMFAPKSVLDAVKAARR